MTSPLRRRRPPHLRQPGATYLVSWDLHSGQPPLTEAERGMVLETLQHFDGTHYELLATLVLDSKVYALLTPQGSRPLERTVGGWKRWTSGQFGVGGRTHPFWRRGYLDRIMRGPEEVDQRIRQMTEVPGRRWPGTVEYPWLWVRGGFATSPSPGENGPTQLPSAAPAPPPSR
jgi:hypothetical protein